MKILLVSQCEKRALTETRRILDQFAERRGDRTWQTPITQEGLLTLRKLLRKTARKNTAVACHWIRGRNHTELLWIVGDGTRFNALGTVPTNTTSRDILRQDDEKGWQSGDLIGVLTALSALLHDVGKACDAFQDKLKRAVGEGRRSGTAIASDQNGLNQNEYRHEWVSLRLFQSFVLAAGHNAQRAALESSFAWTDRIWLDRLANCENLSDSDWIASWLDGLVKDGISQEATADMPLDRLEAFPFARAIGWLVVSHHRLPNMPDELKGRQGILSAWPMRYGPAWNGAKPLGNIESAKTYWTFGRGLPMQHPAWRREAARLARQLLKHTPESEHSAPADVGPSDARQDLATIPARSAPFSDPFFDPFIMHLSRLALMLADHHYSSLNTTSDGRIDPGRTELTGIGDLFANTYRGVLNQSLEEHLIGVTKHSRQVTWALPSVARDLPRLARHKVLRQRSTHPDFRWQDKAFAAAELMRRHSEEDGAFIVNMASTGCGKTLGNARIMYGLSDPEKGMRCAFAIGLRTLTLQTGRAFQQLLSLGEDELAVRVGSSAVRELFLDRVEQAERTGSESCLELLDESSHVMFDGNESNNPVLNRAFKDPDVRKLLLAPVLVCTIDHLTPATESERGGRQIAPMLRLLSGDLVLDEPDDFDVDDLPALARLVNWAGLLGARVLLSSATLPPALVSGLFDAYREGRRHFNANRRPLEASRADEPSICCLWVDESAANQIDCKSLAAFSERHHSFVQARAVNLAASPSRRRFKLLPLKVTDPKRPYGDFAQQSLDAALELHESNHLVDAATQSRVSFGLVRMANIGPLFEAARAMYRYSPPLDTCVHLCVYHSQFPLIVRSHIEENLDCCLDRRVADSVLLKRMQVQPHLASGFRNHIFIVLGSPVTEVGRDHDYDWAIVEPSSMRSLIQLAGRIRRHRMGAWERHNILIFKHNLRHFTNAGGPSFCRPGFESSDVRLSEHDLACLLPDSLDGLLDARPRILADPKNRLSPNDSLIDIEHFVLSRCMDRVSGRLNATDWWRSGTLAQLTALLPANQPFRKSEVPEVDVYLRPDDDGSNYVLTRRMESQIRGRRGMDEAQIDRANHIVDSAELQNRQVLPWCFGDYHALIAALAEEKDESLLQSARRFGSFSLPISESRGWASHPYLGFTVNRA